MMRSNSVLAENGEGSHRLAQPILYRPAILGLASYNPYGRRKRLLDHVREVLETYASLLPLTVRQIYYRLVATHEEYPKEQKFYRGLVETLALARRGGLIDWSSIRDDGVRTEYCGGGFDDLYDFKDYLSRLACGYGRDKSLDQPKQIFVLCEAAGMVPQIERACGDYPVTIKSSGGMDSVTAKYDLARNCTGRDSVVLHVGDYDPTGLSIYHQLALDVPAMIADHCEARDMPAPAYDCKRVTILEHHVAEHGLLTGTIKASDGAKDWYPGIGGNRSATCEAEALPPDILSRLVRDAVEAELDLSAYRQTLDMEERERELAVEAVSNLSFDGGAI